MAERQEVTVSSACFTVKSLESRRKNGFRLRGQQVCYHGNMDAFRFWTLPDRQPDRTDCLVVLSYAVEDDRIPTAPTRAAIRLAYDWWQRFPKAIVIMSTGDNQGLGVPNSAVMKRYAVTVGIPARKVIEEPVSLTTYENLKYSEQLFRKRKLRHILLVTYDLHLRRALAVARTLGWRDFAWVSAAGPGSPAFGIKRFQTYSRVTVFLYEIAAFSYNLLRGEIR